MLIALICFPIFAYSKVAVIANKGVKASGVNKAKITDMYSLDLLEVGGTQIKLFDFEGNNTTKTDFFETLGKSPTEMNKVWLKKKLTGNGNPPTKVGDDAEMLKKVASTAGGIGYIDAGKVDGSVQVLAEF